MFETYKDKLISIAKGAAIAAVGAVVPALLEFSGTLDDGTAFGALLGAAIAIGANALRKFVLTD